VTEAVGDLARQQLNDLIEVSGGAVELVDEVATNLGPKFVISLDNAGIEHGPAGVMVRARERFEIVTPPGFPFEPPWVWSAHRRWSGTPHVQFGRFLCLYAAQSVEWVPADGMRGFIERLSQWLERAAAGTLDPDGQPLHPPAVYSKVENGSLLIHPDVGEGVPWASNGTGAGPTTLVAWCIVEGRRIDILEWIDWATAFNRGVDGAADVFHRDLPVLVMPLVLICDQLGFEYPQKVKALSDGLAESGYSRENLLSDLASATVINRALRKAQREQRPAAAGKHWHKSDDDEAPLLTAMMVGTPARRLEGERRVAHLAAWKLDDFSADVAGLFVRAQNLAVLELTDSIRDLAFRAFDLADVGWMDVLEARPEVTRRRDAGTPSSWLADKRVLVLGCGALGAPVAEFCVRAGVKELTVADQGIVTPGILVRQPYTDDDIGRSKAGALAERLSSVRPDLRVDPLIGNVRTEVFGRGQDLDDYDLVIDATADAGVRSVIERARRSAAGAWPPLVTMVIGHEADRGLVTVNLPNATGAGQDAFRKLALHACTTMGEWADVADDFFPLDPRTDHFFPEPGCSSPTFIGSAAQTAALGGMLLNEGLMVLTSTGRVTGATTEGPDSLVELPGATSFASAVRIGAASTDALTSRLAWVNDVVVDDASTGYEIRVSVEALAEARAEARRGARIRGPLIETGGMLLGTFDDATGVVNVDRVAGPPPDSFLSETYFQHGTVGVQECVAAEQTRSRRLSGFIGFWHSHPCGEALPSTTDEQGMASIVGPDGGRQRALMMIFGGRDERWTAWRDRSAAKVPDVYARVVPRGNGSKPTRGGFIGLTFDLQALPKNSYFRGGFSVAGRTTVSGTLKHEDGSVPVAWWHRFRRGAQ
jgi:integrative and conjugative element protein (TIGR02256 family)